MKSAQTFGTVLTDEHVTALVAQLDLEQKVRLLTGASYWTLHDEPEIGLETIVVSDGPAGVRGQQWDERDTSASLPSPTSMAASWDLDRIRRLGQLIAGEARRKNVDVVLGPTVNIQRSPRGGRHFEAFSEDPWLSGVAASAFVRGVQSCGVGATLKHYVANESETDRFSLDAQVDERTLREVYLAPFERAVTEGGAWLVMSSYNSVNGVTMTENDLLASPLKDEWGFDGVVVSDWMAVRDTVGAGRAAQDLAMPGRDGVWGEALVTAVRDGQVSEDAVDAKVARLLRLAGRVGALDGVTPAAPLAEPWPDDEIAALLREAAADGMVLVRNNGILPLTQQGGISGGDGTSSHFETPTIAVLGQHGFRGRHQGGGSATVFPRHVVSPLEGIRRAFGADAVRYAPGVPLADPLLPLDAAHAADPVSGTPGVHVRFIDASGAVLLDEQRESGMLMWLGDPVLQETVVVEVHAVFTAAVSGEYALGFAGLGHFRFEIDGVTKCDGMLSPPEGADPVMAFINPPTQSFPIVLGAGQRVELVLEHRPRTQQEIHGVLLTLGYEQPFGKPADELERAAALAADSDVAVVVVGTTDRIETEGFDRSTLQLPDGHDELVRRTIEANPRTVVVVNAGSPVIMPGLNDAAAVLLTWFPGQEFGDALADVLAGFREPGGRLPNTWPATEDDVPVWQVEPVDGRLFYDEGLHVGYREWVRRGAADGPAPAIPFGYGLGYTSWSIGEPALTGHRVTVTVTNTGSRSGKHVVQVYLSRASESHVDRPALWLAGFALVNAEPGEKVTATIDLEGRSLQYWSVDDHAWRTEPGTYLVHVGTSVADLHDPIELTVAQEED
jgi:beta-glucosidase